MKYTEYLFDGGRKYRCEEMPTKVKKEKREKAEKRLQKNRAEIALLQDALYAEGKQSLLVIFQAMDAGGKDGTVKHIFTGVNPQGIQITSFKEPTSEDLAHGYLWRVHQKAPERGKIGIFNRSHYEDVLIGRVLNLPAGQPNPERVLEESLWKRRYRQIRDFEQYLYENGTTILKFYLHISPEEQAKRFRERLEDPSKNWKFSEGDLRTRTRWEDYMRAYEDAINETAAHNAPWFVIPADRKWYARALISEIVSDALKEMQPAYPEISEERLDKLRVFYASLQEEEGGEEEPDEAVKEDIEEELAEESGKKRKRRDR